MQLLPYLSFFLLGLAFAVPVILYHRVKQRAKEAVDIYNEELILHTESGYDALEFNLKDTRGNEYELILGYPKQVMDVFKSLHNRIGDTIQVRQGVDLSNGMILCLKYPDSTTNMKSVFMVAKMQLYFCPRTKFKDTVLVNNETIIFNK